MKLLTQPNVGVCATVNRGVRASKGEFVLRLDADDRLAPTYVEETLEALQRDPTAHFAYTQVVYFGATTGTYPIEEFDPDTLAERNYVHASALMRRASFEKVGGLNTNMTSARYEDWDLWLAFAERGLSGIMVPRPLLHYRQHETASRGTLRVRSISDLMKEIAAISRLQDNHPSMFTPQRLVRRLARLGYRVRRGEVSGRFVTLLTSMYGIMLVRSALGNRQRLGIRPVLN